MNENMHLESDFLLYSLNFSNDIKFFNINQIYMTIFIDLIYNKQQNKNKFQIKIFSYTPEINLARLRILINICSSEIELKLIRNHFF